MTFKDTVFLEKTTINCKGRILDLSGTSVMGILNVTPDSFYDGGRYVLKSKILEQTNKMLEEGADIIDIGGVSSRPGSQMVDEKEESKRVIPVVKLLIKKIPDIVLSIDTFRSSIAEQAVEEGAAMINDISAGNLDNKMFETIASLNVPYIIMHMQSIPEDMQQKPTYENVMLEIMDFFIEKIQKLRQLGVKDIIVDPGFGFGKTLNHNYEILRKLNYLKCLNLPLMIGISRKSMVNKVLNVQAADALNGTTVLHTLALQNDINLLRVHDVKEAVEVIKIKKQYGVFI